MEDMDLNRCVISLAGSEPPYSNACSIDDARLKLTLESSRNRSLASVGSPSSPWDYQQHGFGIGRTNSNDDNGNQILSKRFSTNRGGKNSYEILSNSRVNGNRKQPKMVKECQNQNNGKNRVHDSEVNSRKARGGKDSARGDFTVSLREWLKSEWSKRTEKAERLGMFRQIVELVVFAHSQGSSLRDLKPSSFSITMPSNQIRYTGPLVMTQASNTSTTMDIFMPQDLNKKRPLDPNTFDNHNVGGVKKPKLNYENALITRQQLMMCESEKKWYTSPDELDERVCAFSSNIYSLGILLFELLCCNESWETHSVLMSDLQNRILPGKFLSENPIESAICLWLLHPETSSRPTAREILQSELIGTPQDLSSLVDDDPQSELLLKFFSSLKEEKESRSSKLLQELKCLEEDINLIEQKYLSRTGNHFEESSSLSKNEDWLMKNMTKIENAYFEMRSETSTGDNEHFGTFFDGLCKFGRFREFKVCGTLRSGDLFNSTNAICSLSFDRDEEYIAAAKVSKKIKIFEFGSLLNDSEDIHYPVGEMSNNSKLSCISWNNYIKNYLASTDYDGVVKIWDAGSGEGFAEYTEHTMRAWSVDFSRADPTMFASGSDDCSVKLWSVNDKSSIGTIWSPANVCCVQFSDYSSHQLIFGSADYKIYGYDLRHVRVPLWILSGHGKAVSHVKFVDAKTLVSASTDNTLKLWNINNNTSTTGLSGDFCSLTFSGHTNVKNFVGLSALDGYIVCGSETNEVFSYYRSLPMPITSHKFKIVDPISGDESNDDTGQFVSSVCWRRKSNTVVAANSSGVLELLQMV